MDLVPPPSENAALPETEKRTQQGKRGTPRKGGIREIIKYSCHHFSHRELETAVCFLQRRSVGEQGQHAYTLNIWLCNVDLALSSPLFQLQWCGPLCNALFITHQSDPPASPPRPPVPSPPLSPFLPTSLYKANETEVGPLFTGVAGGRCDRERWRTQAGRESEL